MNKPMRCPHCGHTLNAEVKLSSGELSDEEKLARLRRALRVPRPMPVNAIAGPPTIPPRGVR